MTLKIINKLNNEGIKCTILTKGIYPKELTDIKKYSKKNEYGITLVSLDKNFKEKFEPFSASYKGRLKALKRLHDAGLKTWVSMEPYPTPNLVEQNLLRMLQEISFVDNIIFGKLNYSVESSAFEGNEDFYEKCAYIIESFCKARGIKYHIKYGTKKVDNHSTSEIFRKKVNLVSFQIPKENQKLLVH